MEKKTTIYPTWRYHPDFEPMLVQSEEHEKTLGKGWLDSPASFAPESPDPKETPKDGPGALPKPVPAGKPGKRGEK